MNMKTTGVAISMLAAVSIAKTARADCNSSSPCLSAINSGSGKGIIATSQDVAFYGTGTSGGIAVFGNSGNGYGGYFNASGTAKAIYAVSSASGNTPTIWGNATSASLGVGVKGQAVSGGTGVWGYNPGAVAGWFDGNLYMNGSLVQTSDARLKKDVRDLSYSAADLLKLHPVTFKWKSGDDITHLGLIAQEVEKVIPEIVSRGHSPSSDSEVLSVNYTELVPLLIKTVQEQNARINELERARSPVKLSSLYDVGGGTALGLIPLGLVFAARRRKEQVGSAKSE